ncbi:hypothetical protein JM946_13945 [Steroidobacter sp. S1-65]|uniref:Uncharacterized protein n=1 Tax=Steroidobacter gossypii TaxID=2805490 RepID=A0ABS1WXZ6_9GAMM|nr:hypothetical protein [Steroidobacter gossypii]MBM0105838.1 hypothetical protein [Steroidobacter gossypii]
MRDFPAQLQSGAEREDRHVEAEAAKQPMGHGAVNMGALLSGLRVVQSVAVVNRIPQNMRQWLHGMEWLGLHAHAGAFYEKWGIRVR